MPVKVRIPTQLRKLTDGKDVVDVAGETLRETLDNLDKIHPGFRERLFDEHAALRKFVNIYVNDEDSRLLEDLDTRLGDGDVVSIIPAVAGG